MAFLPKIKVCVSNNCSSLLLTEITGVYNSTLNPTGYGTPNPEVDDITETHIIITDPTGNIIDIEDPTGLPSNLCNNGYEITAIALGGTVITDGLYYIEYTVAVGAAIYTSTPRPFLFTCNIQCCVSKLFKKIATLTDCSCDSIIIKNALYADALLEGLKANAECTNPSAITILLTKLNSICNFSLENCGCNN